MLRRLVLWGLRGLAKPLMLLTAFLVLVYVVVGREEGKESLRVPSPSEWSGHDESWQAASRVETNPLARVSCVLGPRGPCERYVAFAVGYQAWLAQARDARASARLTPEMVAALAGAERRARRAVRRRAFDEALQELRTARSAAEAQLARKELLVAPRDSAPTDASAPPRTGHSEVERKIGSEPSRPRTEGSLQETDVQHTTVEPGPSDQPVEITVVSDQATVVMIRGVRSLGRIDRTTVTLRPGTYVFQGYRAGYRATQVEVRVAVGSKPGEVVVVCDERI
ncbi:MAG: hypothetical protein OXF78_01055 [Rhodospirillales bacterium]|nr:hypothetical protein [Rhodospirillales bacterium]